MRVYVAGRTSQTERVQLIQRCFVEKGHEITHDWTGKEGGIKPDWSQHPDEAREIATKDRDGVAKADVVVICGWGCEENSKGGLGCFIEVGIAMALRIPVVVVGPMRESVFWYLPQIERVPDIDTSIQKAYELTGHFDPV